MKIYTKQGDKGKTRLLNGTLVNKNHIRLECYGTLDELNAFIGNIYNKEISENQKNILKIIQNKLFTIGSNISCEYNNNISLPSISKDDIKILEIEIDQIQNHLPKLESFILPSGNEISSACHIARTVCRRAERNLVALLDDYDEINPLYIKYLNRLSDYLFVLARTTLISNGGTEMIWEKD